MQVDIHAWIFERYKQPCCLFENFKLIKKLHDYQVNYWRRTSYRCQNFGVKIINRVIISRRPTSMANVHTQV